MGWYSVAIALTEGPIKQRVGKPIWTVREALQYESDPERTLSVALDIIAKESWPLGRGAKQRLAYWRKKI